MNPYLLFFSLYAVLITPITLHASVRAGKELRYRLRVQAAGLPFVRMAQREEDGERPVREEDVARTLADPWLYRILSAVGIRRLAALLMRAVHLERVYVHVRFSFADAAATALCYAAVQTALRALALAGAAPKALYGRVEMDFGGRGTELFARGIITARLGSLGMAAILVGAAMVSGRAGRGRTEEEAYAAASH